MLIDRFNRSLTYLRISITDRCNYRCIYCMPPEGVPFRAHSEILTFEEITAVARAAAQMGIKRLRLTGGEPLVRRGVVSLVSMLAAIPGIEDISLTTNGHMLEEMAPDLATAGLNRVNISLDTINSDLFTRITRGGSLDRVMAGIRAAQAAGLEPVKINCVVIRGINDQEITNLARLSVSNPWQVRFIEFMPVENQGDWGAGFPLPGERFIPVKEMRSRLADLHMQAEEENNGCGPARIYRIPDGLGTVGFISPVGEHFCQACNRLRLTADGNLKPCLLHSVEIPLREALRRGEDITPYIEAAAAAKPVGHTLKDKLPETGRSMSQIGG